MGDQPHKWQVTICHPRDGESSHLFHWPSEAWAAFEEIIRKLEAEAGSHAGWLSQVRYGMEWVYEPRDPASGTRVSILRLDAPDPEHP